MRSILEEENKEDYEVPVLTEEMKEDPVLILLEIEQLDADLDRLKKENTEIQKLIEF